MKTKIYVDVDTQHDFCDPRGALFVKGTLPEKTVFVPNVPGLDAGEVPEGATGVLFEKEVYSMFANPSAEQVIDGLLARRGLSREDVEAIVFGVATDFCVKAAALGLRERGFDVAVVSDAIAAVDPVGGALALEEMRAAGCRLITTGEAV